MGYTPEMLDLIKKVEASRPERLERSRKGVDFEALTLAGREDVLSKFHPDYKPNGRRDVKIGPSKGENYPDEFVDVLEAKARLLVSGAELEKLTEYTTDVLVIGGGGAGTSAALMAQEGGCKVVMATKLRHGDANTVMAEGGIQGASQEVDSPYYHYLDVIGGGHFTNTPELVAALTNDAPLVIEWLERLGLMFDKDPDGRMRVRHGGGTCRKRMHSSGDMTGSAIMRVLRDESRNRADDIEVLEFSAAVEILKDSQGRAAGALFYNMETEEYFVVKAKSVIIATGGYGRLHIQGFATTNHYGATADGLVMGYRAGVPLAFMHSTQYHPTGVAFPEQNIGLLITEKVRGLGANLLNIEGEQFVFEREPRDVESACIIRECMERGSGIITATGRVGVWLDSPMIEVLEGEGAVKRELPAKHIQFMRYGIDISKVPMLVYPTLHYQNGGLTIADSSATNVSGLFAAGEATGGVHGENRLMGNSLLDITVFGRRAGVSAAAYAKEYDGEVGDLNMDHVDAYHKELLDAGIETDQVAPMILPNYTREEVMEKQLTTNYQGGIRA
ncbi:MAG: succinate dehydrogenase/fumarate reductase flavoprotein subunit [Deltaproteobacteria bacterium]|nr:MAG: succinate dehydrogenase/fumarate reductase flavoprotein subunit [Deltaproteobacteria bacterium]